jgi:hypothetical protein
MDKDLVFITSAGRTATMFLGLHLSKMILSAFSVHEPDLNYGLYDPLTWHNVRQFGLYHMFIGRSLGGAGARVIARSYLTGRLSHAEAVKRARASRTRYFASREESLIIESNYQWAVLLPVLRDAFPKAKIVCILRDKKSWVSSWMRKGGRYDKRDPVRRGRLTPVMLGISTEAEWRSLTVAEKLGWEWEFVTAKLTEFAKEDSLARLYSYENLFLAKDNSTFRDLLMFIASHDGRCYPVQFVPQLLNQRDNATIY